MRKAPNLLDERIDAVAAMARETFVARMSISVLGAGLMAANLGFFTAALWWGGVVLSEIVTWFGIHARTLRRWKQARRERGSVATRPRSGRIPKIGSAQHEALRAQVAAHPDATLAEHADFWEAATGVRVSVATLSRLFARLRITRKKRR